MSTTLSPSPFRSVTPHLHLLSGIPMPISSVNPMRAAGWCALEQAQDAGTVDRGYDVTKFSTRLGPPTCSPPV